MGDLTLSIVADSKAIITEIAATSSGLADELQKSKREQLLAFNEVKVLLKKLQTVDPSSKGEMEGTIKALGEKMNTDVQGVMVKLQASSEFTGMMRCELNDVADQMGLSFAELKQQVATARVEDKKRFALYTQELTQQLEQSRLEAGSQHDTLERHLSSQDEKLDEVHSMLKVLTVMDEASREEANKLFQKLDANKDGSISPNELMMSFLGNGMVEEDVSRLFRRMDLNKDGLISRDEFAIGYANFNKVRQQTNDKTADAIAAKRENDGESIVAPTPEAVLKACKKGKTSVLKKLIDGKADVNEARDEEDEGTALHYAAGAGHEECVVLLLEAKADMSLVDSDGDQALTSATSHIKTVVLLLEAKSDVNFQNKSSNETALHSSVDINNDGDGDKDVVSAMLAAKADANLVNDDGQTPLHYASFGGFPAVVTMLLQAGADAGHKDNELETPLHRAAYGDRLDVVVILLTAGVKVNAKDHDKDTPLHRAANENAREVIEALLEADADVNAKNCDKETPLHYAAKEGATDAIAALLEADANIKFVDATSKNTALHFAAENGHTAAIRFLVKAGANTKAENEYGDTPKDLAEENGELKAYHKALKGLTLEPRGGSGSDSDSDSD